MKMPSWLNQKNNTKGMQMINNVKHTPVVKRTRIILINNRDWRSIWVLRSSHLKQKQTKKQITEIVMQNKVDKN